jgi:hypothetical protein
MAVADETEKVAEYPCWCDGEPTCNAMVTEKYGLCVECRAFCHGSLPHIGLDDDRG